MNHEQQDNFERIAASLEKSTAGFPDMIRLLISIGDKPMTPQTIRQLSRVLAMDFEEMETLASTISQNLRKLSAEFQRLHAEHIENITV